MKKNREEMIPQVVEDRLQAAYEQIRKGEISVKLISAKNCDMIIKIISAKFLKITIYRKQINKRLLNI